MTDILDRFTRLVSTHRREVPSTGKDKSAPSESSLLAESLHDWASRSECKGAFATYLDNRIETAEAERRANIEVHALAALWEGYVAGLKDVRADLAKWRGDPGQKGN